MLIHWGRGGGGGQRIDNNNRMLTSLTIPAHVSNRTHALPRSDTGSAVKTGGVTGGDLAVLPLPPPAAAALVRADTHPIVLTGVAAGFCK